MGRPFQVYIATSIHRVHEHNELRDALARHGIHLTFDWTGIERGKVLEKDLLMDLAFADAQGVMVADVTVVLIPGAYGTHAELGMAIVAANYEGRTVICHALNGKPEPAEPGKWCIFYEHPAVRWVDGPLSRVVEEVLALRQKLEEAGALQ